MVLKSAAGLFFLKLVHYEWFSAALPSPGQLLTIKSLVAFDTLKEGIQGGGGGEQYICEMATEHHRGHASREVPHTQGRCRMYLPRVAGVGWPCLVYVGELLIVALLGTPRVGVPHG